MQIHPKVTQIGTQFGEVGVELYLIKGETIAIVDTGISQSPQKDIAPALKELRLTLANIDLILNTHGHFDHIGGNAAIQSAGNAQILIHHDDVVFLQDHKRCFEQYWAPVVEATVGKEHMEEVRTNLLQMSGPNVDANRQLEDNDFIDLGHGCQLQVIHLPGHTPGSVGFYWEKEGMLFSGDSLPGLHIGTGGLPVIDDLIAYENSLKRLQKLSPHLILQGHHYRGLTLPPSPIRRSDEIKQYLKDCENVATELRKAVRHIAPHASRRALMELADEVVTELPKEMGFKPVSQMANPVAAAWTIFYALNPLA